MNAKPSFEFEAKYDGNVCGIDEAGRGPLVGPVVSACVLFREKNKISKELLNNLNDSKKLTEKKREELYYIILLESHVGIGIVSNYKIDEINILQATLLSMKIAYENLKISCDCALIDGNKVPDLSCVTQAIVKGDSLSFSIAASSIIAKVTRDRIMYEFHKEYPNYGWDRNKGYPTKTHKDAINEFGITPYHRKSFKFRT